MSSSATRAPPFTSTDLERLQQELRAALSYTDRQQLQEWGARSSKRFGVVLVKRVSNLALLLARVTDASADELFNALQALSDGRLGEHVANRGAAASNALLALQEAISKLFSRVADQLENNASESASQLFAAVLGFYAGSGGDGDGGIPDLDLMAGIGAHRSIFTHSIITGAFVETSVLSILDLANVIHANLPEDRDPLWDQLLKYQRLSGESFVTGASLGIAAHLGIDTTIDGFTPYKDLPISLPLGLHEALMGLNASAEGAYGLHRATEQAKAWIFRPDYGSSEYPHREGKSMPTIESDDVALLLVSPGVDVGALRSLSAGERLKVAGAIARDSVLRVHLSVDSLERTLNACNAKIENAGRPFRLGVVGEFRAGKSTLINALIGEDVAFVDFIEATPAECVFRYGDERQARIVHLDGTTEEVLFDEANRQLSDRREDAAWLATVRDVEYIVPSARLRSFDLWDAPGMGGSRSGQAVADDFLDKLGAALWVFDATLLGKATIASPLRRLKRDGKPVIAVINRIDEFTDSIEDATRLLRTLYPETFDSVIALSALKAIEAAKQGEASSDVDLLWKEIERCVGVSGGEGRDYRIERAAQTACEEFGEWVTATRRKVQDMIGLVDHMRENLQLSRQRLLDQLETILAEEAGQAFRHVELELASQVKVLDSSSDSVAKVIAFFNDPRTQQRITQEIFERTLTKVQHFWQRYSDQAIDLSVATLPATGISDLRPSISEASIRSQVVEEGVYTGGASLAVAAVIAATTAVTWPAILVAIPIGSLAAWKKRRDLERGRSAVDEFAKAMVELHGQFVAKFLPSASAEIKRSLTHSIQVLIDGRCKEVLGEDNDVSARRALADLSAIESALTKSTSLALQDWSTAANVVRLLQNPGPRLDIFSPTLEFSLAPVLQGLPPETMVRLVTTCDESRRKALNGQAAQAFGNWQGKHKVICVCMADGSAVPSKETLLVTTDEALVAEGTLARLADGDLEFRKYAKGRLAGQRHFGELWDGWSSVYGELRRYPLF